MFQICFCERVTWTGMCSAKRMRFLTSQIGGTGTRPCGFFISYFVPQKLLILPLPDGILKFCCGSRRRHRYDGRGTADRAAGLRAGRSSSRCRPVRLPWQIDVKRLAFIFCFRVINIGIRRFVLRHRRLARLGRHRHVECLDCLFKCKFLLLIFICFSQCRNSVASLRRICHIFVFYLSR